MCPQLDADKLHDQSLNFNGSYLKYLSIHSILNLKYLPFFSISNTVVNSCDPSVNVVLTEDAAAVLSVGVTAACMGLSTVTGSHVPDAVGSLLVGCILGAVASFIIYTNVAALMGRSITEERLDKINTELESDIMIRAIYDVKGIDMGNSLVRYKAELDFDGRELSKVYLDKQDLNLLLEVSLTLKFLRFDYNLQLSIFIGSKNISNNR